MIENSGQPALFVATATADDEEMAARILAHQESRPKSWHTVESKYAIGNVILKSPITPWVLIDCITLLASNLLLSCAEPVDEQKYKEKMKLELDTLLQAYHKHPAEWLIVSNEVGLGLVPPYTLGRYYRDALGWANQELAKAADEVIFMVAGIPTIIKSYNQ